MGLVLWTGRAHCQRQVFCFKNHVKAKIKSYGACGQVTFMDFSRGLITFESYLFLGQIVLSN